MITFDLPFSMKVVTPALFCVLSLMASVTLVMCYKKVVRMRYNAGKILLHIVICETLLTLLYIFSFFYVDPTQAKKYSGTFTIEPSGCKLLGFFQVFLSVSYCLLNTALIHNFYSSLTQKQKTFCKRNKFYTWGTLSVSLVLSILAIAHDALSLTPYGFCGINYSSAIVLAAFFPLCISYPFGIYAIIHAMLAMSNDKKENQKQQLISDPYEYQVKLSFVKSHVGFIGVFFFTWFPFYVDNLVNYFNPGSYSSPGIAAVTLNLLSVTSFLRMVVRLTDPLLRKVLRKAMKRRFWSLSSGKNSEASDNGWPKALETPNEPIALQSAYLPEGETDNPLTRTFADPQMTKFRSIAPKVGCNKTYGSMTPHEFNLILLSLENVIPTQEFDAEPPENPQQMPWPQFYYSQICVRELNLNLHQGEENEEEISLNAIIHAPRVFDHLLATFSLTRNALFNSTRLDRNKEGAQKGINTKKLEIYKQYQFLTSNKEVLIQRMEKEQKFDFLESFLSAYHQHMMQNPGSCLEKILGLYSLGTLHKKYNLLLIQNVYRPYYDNVEDSGPNQLLERLVLDGHCLRKENLNGRGVVIRSRKFTISSKLPESEPALFQLRPKDRVRLLQIIRHDIGFLEKAGILEYKINFLISRNHKKQDSTAPSMHTSCRNTLEDWEFLNTLTTADEEFRVGVFISLDSFIHAKKVNCGPGEDSCLFSRANPQLYRQCIEEFLYQYL